MPAPKQFPQTAISSAEWSVIWETFDQYDLQEQRSLFVYLIEVRARNTDHRFVPYSVTHHICGVIRNNPGASVQYLETLI